MDPVERRVKEMDRYVDARIYGRCRQHIHATKPTNRVRCTISAYGTIGHTHKMYDNHEQMSLEIDTDQQRDSARQRTVRFSTDILCTIKEK